MSFTMADESEISRISILSVEKREQLFQKLKQHLKDLNVYKDLFDKNQKGNIQDNEKIVLAAYQELFSNLKNRADIDKRISQVLVYQHKLDNKDVVDSPKPSATTATSSFTPAYRTVEFSRALKLEKINAEIISKDKAKREIDAAIKAKEYGKLTALLSSKPKKTPADLGKALFTAIESEDFESLNILLEAGADPNVLNNRGWSPLYWALQDGDEKMIEALLKHGANANQPASAIEGRSSIIISAVLSHSELRNAAPIIKLLLKYGADPNEVLFRTIIKKAKPLVEIALEYGADPNFLDPEGLTPMGSALTQSTPEIVEILRENTKISQKSPALQKWELLTKTEGVMGVAVPRPLRFDDEQLYNWGRGGFAYQSFPWLTDYLDHYCEKLKSKEQSELLVFFKKIQKAYERGAKLTLKDHMFSFNDLLEAHKAGEPILFPGSWNGHAIAIAFFRDKAGFANRGENKLHKRWGTGYFTMADPSQLTGELYKNLNTMDSNGVRSMEKISGLAGDNTIGFLETSSQKWENCFWANPKTCIELFLYWLSLESGESEIESKDFALKEYKAFTEFVRNEMCQELIDHYHNAYPQDHEFYENLFAEIIKAHHGAAVSSSSRNPGKIMAEINRTALLMQALAREDKDNAREFLVNLGPALGKTLKEIAKDEIVMEDALKACGFFSDLKGRPKFK